LSARQRDRLLRKGNNSMATQDSAGEDEIDLGELVRKLWKGKLLILVAAIIGGAIAAFVIANTRPTYQADALLQLEEKTGALSMPSALAGLAENDPRSVTEIEILRSRMVLGQAVANQNLDWSVQPDLAPVIGVMASRYDLPVINDLLPARYARPGESVEIEQLIVPPEWVNLDFTLEAAEANTYLLTTPLDNVITGTVGQALTLRDQGFTITVSAINAPSGRRFTLKQIDEIRAISSLRSRLSVSERGRSSGILEVRLSGEDRIGNSRTLNAVVQAYLRQNIDRSAAEAESSLTFIREQLPQAEANLRQAEVALNDYRQLSATIDLTLETQTILEQITRIETEISDLQRREAELANRYTPAHPAVRQVTEERQRLEERLAQLRGQVGELPETQRQILNLTRNVELTQQIYTELLTRAQEVEVLRASTIGNVRIVDIAAAGTGPIAPRAAVLLALGLILGGFAGITLVLVRGWMNKGVQQPADLENLGLSVFATINRNVATDAMRTRKGNLPILALESPTDLTIEALRSLRTSLHFGMLDAKTPTLTITSSHPGAGKSFLASNLAVVAAQAGQSVCLIDADLRRGHLRRYFNVKRGVPGLTEVLSGDIGFAEALVQGPVENLVFLPSGRYPPNPSEILMRAELSRLIEACAENFDLTIFDAPPVLAVTDPVILSKSTGSTIFVARHDQTPIGEIEAALKVYSAAGLKFAGAVLNDFDPKKAGGYGYGYGYRYEYQQRKE
tara:strand:+ start:1440 stop:3656 length:2217 start_codon:yes stop_codon:yes gene_type:complete